MGWRRNSRVNPQKCSHSGAITVRSTGVERFVCETCGHLSISFVTAQAEDFRRDVFARQADDTPLLGPAQGDHLVPVAS